MITIQIDSKQATHFLTNLQTELPKSINRGINKFTGRLANEIKKEAKLREHYTTGYLSGRGTYAKKISEGTWAVKMPYYDKYLEEGTLPHFIPRNRITQLWAKRHGMSFGRFKWIVAKYGTKPHPFTEFVLMRELDRLKGTVEKEINKGIRKSKR